MDFFQALHMAWGSLRANKLRTALTLLGMVIGVFAIITSVTAVSVIDVYFEEKMNFLGSGSFRVSKNPAVNINGNRSSSRKNITFDQVERLKGALRLPLTVSVFEDFDMGAMRYKSRETEPNTFLFGADQHFLGNFSYELEQGRFLSPEDVHYGRPVIILGAAVAEELFVNETPLGKDVTMNGRRYQVVGVLAAKGNFLGFNQDTRVIAPITHLIDTYGDHGRNMASISIRAPHVGLVPAAMDEVIGRMRTIRKVPPGEDNDFEVETNDSMRGIFDAFTGALTTGGAGIGLIALFAAGIGIMNIMLVSVTERTREVGIRKSVGAKRKDIMWQFLLEAFFLCQLGGFIGIVLGVLAGNGVALYFGINATVPWGWALAAIIMVSVVSLVFGGYPAYKAARLDPIESLRYE